MVNEGDQPSQLGNAPESFSKNGSDGPNGWNGLFVWIVIILIGGATAVVIATISQDSNGSASSQQYQNNESGSDQQNIPQQFEPNEPEGEGIDRINNMNTNLY